MSLGPELIIDGTFAAGSDWMAGAGFAITGGKATYLEAGGGGILFQFLRSMVTGHTYQLTFDASAVSLTAEGYVDIMLGDLFACCVRLGSAGSFSLIAPVSFVSPDDQAVAIVPRNLTNGDTFTLDNISVREVLADAPILTPSLSVAAGTDDLTVTIAGTSGATHTVLYKLVAASAWTAGGSRVGNGTVVISGLSEGSYQVLVTSALDGVTSAPSVPATASIVPVSLTLPDPVVWAPSGLNGFEAATVACAVASINLFDAIAISYQPYGGTARTILALMDFESVGGTPAPHGTAPQLKVSVLNSSLYGISASELDTGKDTIRVPLRVGGELKTRVIKQILEQNTGMLTLEVR